MRVDRAICCGCSYCVLVCPRDAVVSDGTARLLPGRCNGCGLCIFACPTGAITEEG